VVGNGTGSREMAQRVSAAVRPLEVVLVQEHRTSELARARYLAEHPPRGWRRLIPRGLRTPDEPYDDLVAVILGENWWAATCEQPNRC
jgi:hypothetical protein